MNLEKASKSTCASCPKWAVNKDEVAIQRILQAYLTDDKPWYLGFSGGKDSSAVLKLVYQALCKLRTPHKTVTAVYCDTGVDIPVVSRLVKRTLRNISREALKDSVPLRIKMARPRLQDRYFVKVIGRGYPPPTNKFRWCTDKLRIDPVKRVLEEGSNSASLILLGLRNGESVERDRTLSRHDLGNGYFRQTGNSKVTIFTPILDYSTNDVWSVIMRKTVPNSINGERLLSLYKEASGECPTIRDPHGSPCGKGRFGCWTCTVVRKDKAMTSMIAEGYPQLLPLLRFRDWLMRIRDHPDYRHTKRRNGLSGAGPFRMAARKLILKELLTAETAAGFRLINRAELEAIKQLWHDEVPEFK